MDNVAVLLQKWDAYKKAHRAFNKHQYSADLSFQERQEYFAARNQKLSDLNEILEVIKIEDVIELTSIKHAKMMIEMLPEFFINRGNLNHIRIPGHVWARTRTQMTSRLRRKGFVVVDGREVIIRFPG